MMNIAQQAFFAPLLAEISESILTKLQLEGPRAVLDLSTETLYDDELLWIGVKPALLQPWADRIDVTVMSAGILKVLTPEIEIHKHLESVGRITVLGPGESFEEPVSASYYFRDSFHDATSGDVLEIFPGMAHGFASGDMDAPLILLSIQSHAITDDDYHLVT